jgi:hypothetical protein
VNDALALLQLTISRHLDPSFRFYLADIDPGLWIIPTVVPVSLCSLTHSPLPFCCHFVKDLFLIICYVAYVQSPSRSPVVAFAGLQLATAENMAQAVISQFPSLNLDEVVPYVRLFQGRPLWFAQFHQALFGSLLVQPANSKDELLSALAKARYSGLLTCTELADEIISNTVGPAVLLCHCRSLLTQCIAQASASPLHQRALAQLLLSAVLCDGELSPILSQDDVVRSFLFLPPNATNLSKFGHGGSGGEVVSGGERS